MKRGEAHFSLSHAYTPTQIFQSVLCVVRWHKQTSLQSSQCQVCPQSICVNASVGSCSGGTASWCFTCIWRRTLILNNRNIETDSTKYDKDKRRQPTTNSAHIWRRSRELNPGHIGGRRALSPCANLDRLVFIASVIDILSRPMHNF